MHLETITARGQRPKMLEVQRYTGNDNDLVQSSHSKKPWSQGYKTFFMLNTAEHEI